MPWISSIYFILNKNTNFTSSIIAALVLVQSKYFLHVFARYLNGILVVKIDIWVKWLTCFAKRFSKITFSCLVWFTPSSKRASERGVQPGETTGAIECFHSRGQHLCKFIGTKKSVCLRKEFNSQSIGLGHQNGGRFIVLGRQYGRRDVMWKHSIFERFGEKQRINIPKIPHSPRTNKDWWRLVKNIWVRCTEEPSLRVGARQAVIFFW